MLTAAAFPYERSSVTTRGSCADARCVLHACMFAEGEYTRSAPEARSSHSARCLSLVLLRQPALSSLWTAIVEWGRIEQIDPDAPTDRPETPSIA